MKEREFAARRFRYREEGLTSIDEAREIADADGTGSILDIDTVGSAPDFGVVVLLTGVRMKELFGTEQPTRADLENGDELFDDIERGQGVCCPVFTNGAPSEICFTGYSYD